MITAKREARIILPVYDNDGVDLAAVHTDLKRHVCEAFGGYTATPSLGGWLSPTGKIHEEPGVAYDIACEDTAKARSELREIAFWLAVGARQECIYLRLPSGRVEFVQTESGATLVRGAA
jgi:hypothetical protein